MRIDWRHKARLQRAFANLPGGHRLNYALQRLIGGLPISDEKLREGIGLAKRHLDALERRGQTPPGEAHFFEFGAGWDLHIPLALVWLGAGQQTVVDLQPLARKALVEDLLERIPAALEDPAEPPTPGSGSLAGALVDLGITYSAPADARSTGFDPECVDYVTSTNTLEHIPPDEITAIYAECRRIVRPGGVLSFYIDHVDHYSYFDARIGPYNFLRYSPNEWEAYNNALHFQNRLRHRDHRGLIESAGFEILDVTTEAPSAPQLASLEHLDLAAEFSSYALADLAVLRSHFVLRRSP